MRFLTAVALAVVMLWVPVDGVAQVPLFFGGANPLSGISALDLHVIVDLDDEIIGMSEAQFTREVERAFELGILRTRLKVDDSAGDDLYCRIHLAPTGIPDLTVYSVRVDLQQQVVSFQTGYQLLGRPNLDVLMNEGFTAITWSFSAVGSVGVTNLLGRASSIGEECAEEFGRDWRRANN